MAYSSATDNAQLEIEVFLHAQVLLQSRSKLNEPLSVKQLQPLKRSLVSYSPGQLDTTFAINYPDNVRPS